MSTSDLALIVSIGSGLATVLGLFVAYCALRLSAASVPLDFRVRLEGEATQLGGARDPGHWVKGLLLNEGTSCKASAFTVIDWKSPTHIAPGQTPVIAQLANRKTYPRTPEQWSSTPRVGGIVTKRDALQEGLFYPRRMATGDDAPIHIWMPPEVEEVEVSVKVPHRFAATRSHNFWVTNPLFDPRTGKAAD